ncbi:MAG: hypothetical protein RLZZ28_593 [Bacteroidota bacterium]|jgi:lipoprotein Spr
MKKAYLLIPTLYLLGLTGCKSLRGLSGANTTASTAKKPAYSGTRTFMNGIEVSPGGFNENPVKPAKSSLSTDNSSSVKKGDTQTAEPFKAMGIGPENASMLQLKYAIATDATVEKLTNIPLLQVIDKWWGTKYCMGGSTDNCIDCSAFTQILMRDVYQIALPRTSQEQFLACEKIDAEDLREGDLVFFNTSGKDITHVGIYLINNKFVHASTSGGVMITDLNEKYWQPKFRGGGRVMK